MQIYNTNGIPTNANPSAAFYVCEDAIGNYRFPGVEMVTEMEALCIRLHSKLAVLNFGSLDAYHHIVRHPIYNLVALAGIDPEIKIPKEAFENFVNDYEDKETLYRMLYHFDIENLIGTLQSSIMETATVLGEFYKCLNINDFLVVKGNFTRSDGIQFASGPIVTVITSLVNRLFITLYSQLDFITKIVFEIENLTADFASYPRLRSRSILYGDAKNTSLDQKPGTVFEKSPSLRMIIYLRNEIVHNAYIDGLPKVYQNISNATITEKFILLPDFDRGEIKASRNRKRFFDHDTKLNEELPIIITDFWKRLATTLKIITS